MSRQFPFSLGRLFGAIALAAILLLAFASPALANSIAPTAYFWPGVLPLMLGIALPASVVAAVLERPFVSRAGVREYAFWYSLQANFISLMIGYVTLPVGIFAIYTIGPLWSLIAVVMSVVSEGWYYRQRAIKGPERLSWGWIVGGNVFSSFVLLILPLVALTVKAAKPILCWELAPYEDALTWASATASTVLFVGSSMRLIGCGGGWPLLPCRQKRQRHRLRAEWHSLKEIDSW